MWFYIIVATKDQPKPDTRYNQSQSDFKMHCIIIIIVFCIINFQFFAHGSQFPITFAMIKLLLLLYCDLSFLFLKMLFVMQLCTKCRPIDSGYVI